MAANPTPDVLAALRNAASETSVPLALLWGVAFAESGFDPSKVGPETASGRALGLMQLMPKVAAANGVTDPMDAAQSARGGARVLAQLGRALQWNVQAMLAAYVWGPTNYARGKNAGKPVPGEVLTYVKRALAARDVYRNKAPRPPGSLMAATNAAIEQLAELNPGWAPAVMTRDAWRPFYAKRKADTDTAALLNSALRLHWRSYAIAFERAPITDETTPAPALIEPDLWRRAAQSVDRVVKTVKEGAETAALGIGGGLFVLAVFAFAVAGRRR